MKLRIASAACLIFALFPRASYGQVWNLANDFSATQNPNGAWSLGWRTGPGQPLGLLAVDPIRCGAPHELENWDHYIQDYTPRVTRNPQDYTVYCDYAIFSPHKVNFHPGPHQQSVVRFTAPSDMTAMLIVHFQAVDTGSSLVHIYQNDVSLFSAALKGLGEAADYSAALTCRQGDLIDCAIDPISFYGDSVQIDVLVSSIGTTATTETTWGRMRALYR
jgi:hypothetical protein